MWNPVDSTGASLRPDAKAATLQTHLCLLPDQLSIFIRYGVLVGFTLFVLAIRAALVVSGRISSGGDAVEASSILPTTEHGSSAESEKAELNGTAHSNTSSHDTTTSNSSDRSKLLVRNTNARTRSVSPGGGYGLPPAQSQSQYWYPLIQHAGYNPPADEEEIKVPTWPKRRKTITESKGKKKTRFSRFLQEFRTSFLTVALVVFSWYFWLIWNG
jgi:hypothetical protein